MKLHTDNEARDKYFAGKEELRALETERTNILQSMKQYGLVQIPDNPEEFRILSIENREQFNLLLEKLNQLESIMAELANEVNRNADVCGEEKVAYKKIDLKKL